MFEIIPNKRGSKSITVTDTGSGTVNKQLQRFMDSDVDADNIAAIGYFHSVELHARTYSTYIHMYKCDAKDTLRDLYAMAGTHAYRANTLMGVT